MIPNDFEYLAWSDPSAKKLMDGADAPKQWRAGNHQEVMDYCLGDCG
jgi:hypothetical protein